MRQALLTSVIAGAAVVLFAPVPASAQQSGQWGGQQQSGQWGAGQQQFGQQPGQQRFGQQRMQQQFGQTQQLQGEGAPLYVSPNEVMEVQSRLARMGFNPGQTDGQWGQQTQEAVRDFQRRNGLSPTGNLNLTTLSALGVALGQGGQFLGLGQQQGPMQQRGMGMQQRGMGMQRGWGQSGQGGGQQGGSRFQQQTEEDSN